MSARRQIVAALSEDSHGGIATLSDVDHAEQLVDAHRTEVLAKAIGRLRAIPVDCTALTGPVWYGDGWNSAITCLEEIAEYSVPDYEAYPGELQRLRALALGLRVAALRKEDLVEAQRLLLGHAAHERKAREKATAAAAPATPFFQPGRTYTRRNHGETAEFQVQYIGTDPEFGDRQAFGWYRKRPRTSWHPYSQNEVEYTAAGWTEAGGPR